MNEHISPLFALAVSGVLTAAWFAITWHQTRPTTQHQDESEQR